MSSIPSIAVTKPAATTPLQVVLALAAVYLIWGSTYLGIRFALDGYPPFLMGGLRFVAAGALMYAFLRWRGVPRRRERSGATLTVMGLLLVLLGNGMVNLAEKTCRPAWRRSRSRRCRCGSACSRDVAGRHPSRGSNGSAWASVSSA